MLVCKIMSQHEKADKLLIEAISKNEMKESIKRSGYLLEQYIENILIKNSYFVQTNPVYYDADPKTGLTKAREIDIHAKRFRKLYKDKKEEISSTLICECKNNTHPLVFFIKDSKLCQLRYDQSKMAGIPLKIWNKNDYISLEDFIKIRSFHHYYLCKLATQYCSFQKVNDKKKWIALHPDEHHDMFTTLIKVTDQYLDFWFKGWSLPKKLNEEHPVIEMIYPLVVIQGPMYAAFLKRGQLILQEYNHIIFRREDILHPAEDAKTYLIDVVTKDYFQKHYLKIIECEMDLAINTLRRKKKVVFNSINKIVSEAKNAKKQNKTIANFRKYLEYKDN